jgi:hypothetical protein
MFQNVVTYVYIWIPFAFLAYEVLKIVYRFTLHPLAKFPGPNLAAATNLYAIYYDLYKDGGGVLVKHLPALHDKYGKADGHVLNSRI